MVTGLRPSNAWLLTMSRSHGPLGCESRRGGLLRLSRDYSPRPPTHVVGALFGRITRCSHGWRTRDSWRGLTRCEQVRWLADVARDDSELK
jgi:hypothetical protein